MNYNLLEINHPLFNAAILEQGAHIVHFQPKGKEPFLWSAPLDTYIHGKPFRGGIPICWPWFGKEQSPPHGFARIVDWKMEHRTDSDDGVLLKWVLQDNEATRAVWNHSFKLTLEMNLGSSLKLKFIINAPVQTTGALHTYLSIDTHCMQIRGLPHSYIDSLHNNELVCQVDEALLIDKPIDRIYPHSPSETIIGDKMVAKHDNHSDVVVWNPWIEGVKNIADMSNDDYLHMVCIETARISRPFESMDNIGVEISQK